MQTIAVFNTRGGAGKSAATVFLADFLSSAFNKRVLVVDLDPQQSSAVALVGDEALYKAFEQKKSLPPLLARAFEESIKPNVVQYHMIERPRRQERKGVVYLGPVSVLACEREAWDDLDHALSNGKATGKPQDYEKLRTLLHSVENDFDICLIDFPGHEAGPITMNGLRAADWWLFPCIPDRAGIRDIEGPVKAINRAYEGCRRRIQGLGTLISLSQPATSSEYKQSYYTLKQAADKGYIPQLFSNQAKLLIWTGARNALDDTLWTEKTTLAQKYKEKPLFNAARTLSREVLARLALPLDEVKLDFGVLNDLNRLLRNVFVGAKA